MEFKPISYTSTLLWHFVRGSGDTYEKKEESSLSLFLLPEDKSPIFLPNGRGCLLKIPPNKNDFHSHMFSPEGARPKKENDSTEEFAIQEPRSICFADIPMNHLPIHIRRYYGIGLGFRTKSIIYTAEDLKPVEYFPRNTKWTLENSCTDYVVPQTSPFNLKNYAKIPTNTESFNQIYHEREWRTLKNKFEFTHKELAVVFFPTMTTLKKASEQQRFKDFFVKGVGYICGQDLYEQDEAKYK